MKVNPIPTPLNAQEQLLYGINQRLEVLIEQFSSLVEYISERDKVAVESGVVENVDPVRKSRARKVN